MLADAANRKVEKDIEAALRRLDHFDELDEAKATLDRLTPEVQAWQIIDNRQHQLVGVYIRK